VGGFPGDRDSELLAERFENGLSPHRRDAGDSDDLDTGLAPHTADLNPHRLARRDEDVQYVRAGGASLSSSEAPSREVPDPSLQLRQVERGGRQGDGRPTVVIKPDVDRRTPPSRSVRFRLRCKASAPEDLGGGVEEGARPFPVKGITTQVP
jgi:hypothetical protein